MLKQQPKRTRISQFTQRFGKYDREVERFIKFVMIGVVATLVDFATVNLLQATIFPPTGANERFNVIIATIISYFVGICFSFVFNRWWTYPESRPPKVWLQFSQFLSVYIVALFIRTLIISITYPLWADSVWSLLFNNDLQMQLTANRLGTNLATALGIGATMFWNFFANRFWTFGDVD